jgi:hypothetical protein
LTGPFLRASAVAFALTTAGLGAVGLAAASLFAPLPPQPRFITDIFEFTLAAGWSCDLDETEYVCWKGKPPHEATVIIALKRRGPGDNLAAYEEHLRQPNLNGNGPKPTLRSVQRRTLGGYDWVEAVHDSSELRNYLTIYLATVTSQVGVLATFSFHRDYEQAVRCDIDQMMSSLKIHQAL